MADELIVETRWRYVKNTDRLEPAPFVESIDVAGTQHARHTQAVTTTAVVIDMGGLTVGGRVMVRNLDTTAVVIDFDGTKADLISLLGGEKMELRFYAGTTPYVYTAAGTSRIELIGVDA